MERTTGSSRASSQGNRLMEWTAVSSPAAHVSFQGTSSRTDNKDRIKEITLIRRTTVSVVYARSQEMDSIDGELCQSGGYSERGRKTGANNSRNNIGD